MQGLRKVLIVQTRGKIVRKLRASSRKLIRKPGLPEPPRAHAPPHVILDSQHYSTLSYSSLGSYLSFLFPFLQIKGWCPLRSWGRTVGLNCLVGVPEIQEFLPQHCKLVKLTSDIKRPLDSASHGPQTSCSGGQKGLFVVPESSSKTVLFKLVQTCWFDPMSRWCVQSCKSKIRLQFEGVSVIVPQGAKHPCRYRHR